MQLSPRIQYDPLLFVASILIAMGAATAALWIAFHLAKHRSVPANFGAALVMGAAVVGMHFTAVAAAQIPADAICLASGPRLDDTWMAYTVGGATFIILVSTMLLSLYDARMSSAIAVGAEKLRLANEQLEARVRERTQVLLESRAAARAGSEAKSAFVATMSHEIRTPMNAMIGMLELLSFSKLSDDQREMLTAARDSSRSLLSLIDDILDFSKIEVGKLEMRPEPCSVARIVEGVNSTFKHVASGKGLLLSQRVEAKLWPAHLIDPSRLRQILANLVSNAIKFTPAGSVMLEVEALDAAQMRQTLRFTVQDTGIGMSAETQRRLFEPFYQGESNTSRRFGGTGLGLAISRQLAELMGGSLQVSSAERLGTRVSLTLSPERASPSSIRSDGLATRGHVAPLALYAPQGSQVLIVDDHPVNLAMLKRQLKVLGLDADTASSGADGLEKWRGKAHGLVITDLQMPEMDGYAFARAIRSEQEATGTSRPIVVAFTANTQREALERCKDAGMDDFLTKPAELGVLRQKLKDWLGGDVELHEALDGTPAAAGREPLIDRARIRELAGGPDGIAEVLSELDAAVRADIADLQAALGRGDAAAVKRAAHRIKGAALTIGAGRLAALAAQVEAGGATPETPLPRDGAQSLLDELRGVLAAARVDQGAARA
ncbi:MAG: ATP-binding protein [Betaproteobacteria bacterium]